MNTPRLFARPQVETRGWNSEMAWRYGAATLVTLIALAAAQLVLPTKFMLLLGVITLLGVPVSVWMRLHQMRLGGLTVPRPLWNALTVTASLGASVIFLRVPLRNVMVAFDGGISDAALSRINAIEPMLLLVQLFLIFAAFRSFSLISDKDATLATVPSFSVLLLLVPVYPNIEVVCYFLVWTLVATMLFALDHRSEIRQQVTATVPAPAPGQDVKLAARSLAGVLGVSLVVAVALSGLLTARDPRDASSSDSAISLLAMRLTRFSLQTQETSMANGPERQIDFSSGTSLPTRAELWSVSATNLDGEAVNPPYWRLFTLPDYDGAVWSQGTAIARPAKVTTLTRTQWPRPRYSSFGGNFGGGNFGGGNFTDQSRPPQSQIEQGNILRRRDGVSRDQPRTGASAFERSPGQPTFDVGPNGERPSRRGFALFQTQPKLETSFGFPRQTVYYRMTSKRTSLGFVPLLPAPQALRLESSEQDSLSVRADGGVDVSIIGDGQSYRAVSQVPALREYGFEGEPPLRKLAATNRADAPTLNASERAQNLALPGELPERVRRFARNAVRGASAESNNYARAQLLARATQTGAIYTLRPPAIPAGRDAADFFLFESRRGYCTYFAGALTVLCRAQGIPARVVSGFVAPDEEGQEAGIIRDANAHAWTEIWIENWGWALVDATPPDDRGDNAPTFLENWSDLVAAHLDNLLRWTLAHWPPVIGGATLLLLAFGSWRFRGTIARRLGRAVVADVETQRREIAAVYAVAARALARRFRPRQSWETPDEWLHAARAEVPQLPFEPLQILTSLYVRARFSPHDLSADAAQNARVAGARVVWPKKRSARKTR